MRGNAVLQNGIVAPGPLGAPAGWTEARRSLCPDSASLLHHGPGHGNKEWGPLGGNITWSSHRACLPASIQTAQMLETGTILSSPTRNTPGPQPLHPNRPAIPTGWQPHPMHADARALDMPHRSPIPPQAHAHDHTHTDKHKYTNTHTAGERPARLRLRLVEAGRQVAAVGAHRHEPAAAAGRLDAPI